MSDRGRRVSRRGLFGVFRRSAETLRSGLGDVQRAHRGGRRGAAGGDEGAAPRDLPQYDRLLRPPGQLALALAAGPAAWNVDLKGRRVEPGEDIVLRGHGLDEPLVLVRVNAQHWAACSGECPIDGSDIRWRPDEDRLRCPACGSQWRLDGACRGGPADAALGRFVVDAYEDDAGETEIRVHRP